MQTDELIDQTDGPVSRAPDQVEVRRNVWLSAAIAGAAGTVALPFGLRALDGGALLDWATLGVLALVAVLHATALADGRVPLLVADRTGVRLRRGADWQGIAWAEVECLEHLPRRLLRDGHLLVIGGDHEQLVVPLTWATRLSGADRATLSDVLAELAGGRADVVEVVPDIADDAVDEAETTVEIARLPRPEEDDSAPSGADDAVVPGVVDAAADPASGAADEPSDDPAEDPDDDRVVEPDDDRVVEPDEVATGEFEPVTATVAAGEPARPGLISTLLHRRPRATTPPTAGATALRADAEVAELPEARVLRRIDVDEEDELGEAGVRVVDPAGDATEQTLTVVLDELRVQPATEPVVGPLLRTARVKLRLSVDQLAERTRIRPHVIEALEEDDFGPCGGDFYARGHLRTLARVLGIESAPLLTTYDERYADAPVDPRRIFESELAAGSGSAIRGTRGGRNWSVLVAAIMAAVLVWSVARLVMDGPVPIGDTPVLNQSGGIGAPATADSVPVTLTAPSGGAKVVVRDGGGDIVFDGSLAFGQTMELDVEPPVRISSSDGSVTAALDGADARPLGDTGEDTTKVLVP